MPPRKTNTPLNKLVLKERKRNPSLGVRGLSALLKQKYSLSLSKSAIHTILARGGIRVGRGRKQTLLKYKRQHLSYCGLWLLYHLDAEVGIFENLKEEFRLYFPQIKDMLLQKLVILASFSAFLGLALKEAMYSKGLLSIIETQPFSLRKVSLFLEKLSEYKPAVKLEKVRENLRVISTVRFFFNNVTTSYCDAKLATLWDSPCMIRDFFLPLKAVETRLCQMLSTKAISVGYTKSFDYLSPLVFNFISGIASGIAKIELLSEKGRVLKELRPPSASYAFLLGYYPKSFSKGMLFLEKPKTYKKLFLEELEDIFYINILTRFSDAQDKKTLTLQNLLIASKKKSLPSWGVIATSKTDIERSLKQYLLHWPYRDKGFLEDMEVIEKFPFSSEKPLNFDRYIPDYLTFEKEEDFGTIIELLSSIFKERIGNWPLRLKDREATVTVGRNSIRFSVKDLPYEYKKNFNKAYVLAGTKRLWLL